MGSEGEGGNQAAAEAARRYNGYFDFICRGRNQYKTGNVIFAGMTGAFETVDTNGIAADLLRREAMADGSAFMDDLDACSLECRQESLRIIPCSLDNIYAGVNNVLGILFIGHGFYGGQDRQVDAKRVVRHLPCAFDLLYKVTGTNKKNQDRKMYSTIFMRSSWEFVIVIASFLFL